MKVGDLVTFTGWNVPLNMYADGLDEKPIGIILTIPDRRLSEWTHVMWGPQHSRLRGIFEEGELELIEDD